MMQTMQISIALCTYNGSRHLAAQLDSIGCQTRQPFELVVCDDGSTDETAALVERFAEVAAFPVRLFRNPVNLGSTRNFEQAIQLCRGDAIAFCDQDDLWAPDKLAQLAAVLESEPTVAGVFSNAHLIDDRSKAVPGDLWTRFGFTPARQRRFHRPGAARQLIRRDTVTGATMVIRSCWLPRLLPIPPVWVHDGWIALLLASMAELLALPVCPMSYRLHAAQQVGSTQVALHSHLSTPVEKARDFHRNNALRWRLLLDRMQQMAARPAVEERPDPAVLAELRRKVRFVEARSTLLDRSRLGRVPPALGMLPGYVRYEKGLLSLLRDLAHPAGYPSATE